MTHIGAANYLPLPDLCPHSSQNYNKQTSHNKSKTSNNNDKVGTVHVKVLLVRNKMKNMKKKKTHQQYFFKTGAKYIYILNLKVIS